jgi:membrane peptidoglycan carboxypeptidase
MKNLALLRRPVPHRLASGRNLVGPIVVGDRTAQIVAPSKKPRRAEPVAPVVRVERTDDSVRMGVHRYGIPSRRPRPRKATSGVRSLAAPMISRGRYLAARGRILAAQRRVKIALVVVLVSSLGAGALALRSGPRRPLIDWRAQLLQPQLHEEAGKMVQPLDGGGRAELTLSPEMQRSAERLLAEADAVRGAAVVLDVKTGRVLALAGRDRAAPTRNTPALALSVWAPAASVFKLVTSAALVDAGVRPEDKVCYHGGIRSVEPDNLEDHPELDERCRTFAYGLAKSQNAIIGRLAHDWLNPQALEKTARALGFNAAPAFELPVAPSELATPKDALGFARVAAGFWSSKISPLHGALLAATVAREGEMPAPRLIDKLADPDGRALPVPPVGTAHRALDKSTAHALARMMLGTTEWGSASRAFHDPDTHHRALGRVRVAGKTGTLSDKELYYSWFVGFAPADNPQISFAVLLGRDDAEDVKAAVVGRALIASWLTAPAVAMGK